MKKEPVLTLAGFITGVVLTLFVVLIAIPSFESMDYIAYRVVCGTNLKGIGTATTVYANDYNDNYPQLPGNGLWSKGLGFSYYLEKPDFIKAQLNTTRTITASWYLLVREADVSPKSFICPYSPQIEFDGSNPHNRDIVELWDFGYNPHQHVSYAYHNPYGQFPSSGRCSAAFSIAADMNPWFNQGSFVLPGKEEQPPQIITASDESTWKLGNALYHERFGQNVLFADGHTSFEDSPNVGVKNDNIYTFWSEDENPTEQERQGGTAPTSRCAENDAKSEEDSFLGI